MISASGSAGAWWCSLIGLMDGEPVLEHLLERVFALGILERNLAGEHVVKDAAQEIDIGPGSPLGLPQVRSVPIV